eukprot:CAMPEP_0195508264 /NCGR_PEP_ID=MMETSP0794_2-20130614/1517_1 /TAXON_ID=515487 /ORGANISM="Stephanopyxis turris, Strain CCMP 815" /LENGTH=450 /DNA_ID=CAMNT_0040635175 /DNA_START=51 /DNA_END=1403 /DNA_ORIENTATION=-
MPSASKLVCAAAAAAAALTMGPAAVDAAGCNGHSTPGPPNLIPVDENPEYKLLKTTTNGKLYSVGTGDDALQVAHVWGSAYDMGYAQGELLTKEMQEFIPDVYSYLVEQVLGKAANNTLLAWAIKEGVDVALDLSYERTKDFIKPYVIDEMKGIAAATGVEVEMVRRLNWIPELTRGSCSMFGAWGNATATRDGELLQLRALDWDTDGPFKNYPVLVVYHGEEDPSFGNTFASLGFAGFTGTITGMSKNPLAVSEIGVSFPDNTFGPETYLAKGYPFSYLIRDILQYDNTVTDADNRITEAQKTCDLILGVGDGNSNTFHGYQYSPGVANIFNDTDLMPLEDWHPRIEDVVYWGMDWDCPNDNTMLSHQLNAFHGNITAENTIRDILPYVGTGNLHIAIYDHSNMFMHVATARSDGEGGELNAYQRQFLRLNMTQIFDEPRPSIDEVDTL